MANPVLAEVTRGALVESFHRGAFVVVDAKGRLRAAAGDIERPVFPRSAVKAIQALPLVETGAAAAFGYGPAELALAQASHGGEPAHVALARSMLERAGSSEEALLCGAQWPSHGPSAEAMMRRGEAPGQIHNNCSGKHAGMLALAMHAGFDPASYVQAEHPVQRLVHAALEDLTGAAHESAACGIDGCSIPTFAVPLKSLALGFARFGTGEGLAPERAAAARKLFEAAVEYPFQVAGTGRFCTIAMTALGRHALVKTGAEGVFCAALPAMGLGVALKIDDGATRGSQAAMAEILARLVPECADGLAAWRPAKLLNRREIAVGDVRPVAEPFSDLS